MYTDFIYDFDGTLSDSYPIFARSFLTVLQNHGLEDSYENVLQRLKMTLGHAMRHYSFGVSEAQIQAEYAAAREPIMRESAEPIEGAEALLAHVQACGGRNFLYTHSGQIAWDLLEKWGLKKYFVGGVTKDDGFPSKPAPDALFHLFKTYDIKPENALMVGDRSLDLDAGKNAGIHGALLDPDGFYADYPCEHRAARLCELALGAGAARIIFASVAKT